jgi:hypothetical protein
MDADKNSSNGRTESSDAQRGLLQRVFKSERVRWEYLDGKPVFSCFDVINAVSRKDLDGGYARQWWSRQDATEFPHHVIHLFPGIFISDQLKEDAPFWSD